MTSRECRNSSRSWVIRSLAVDMKKLVPWGRPILGRQRPVDPGSGTADETPAATRSSPGADTRRKKRIALILGLSTVPIQVRRIAGTLCPILQRSGLDARTFTGHVLKPGAVMVDCVKS